MIWRKDFIQKFTVLKSMCVRSLIVLVSLITLLSDKFYLMNFRSTGKMACARLFPVKRVPVVKDSSITDTIPDVEIEAANNKKKELLELS